MIYNCHSTSNIGQDVVNLFLGQNLGRAYSLLVYIQTVKLSPGILFSSSAGSQTPNFIQSYVAASKGYIDMVIEPEETRKMLLHGLQVSNDKRAEIPFKKHGIPPF